jgi:hypothetical protein
MFENRGLMKMFGPKRGEIKGGLRKLHNDELHDLCKSTNILRVIKSRKIIWAGMRQVWRRREKHTGVCNGQ